MYLLVAFLVPLFSGMSVMIETMLSNRTFKHPTTMVFYVSLSSALFLPLVLFYGMPTLPSVQLFACYVALAAINVGYLYPYYLALKVIDTSIVAALFALGQISVPIMSYFWLGERLELTQYIGFAVIVLASVALSVKGSRIPKLSKAFYYMVFAAIINSMTCVLEKYALNVDGNWINLAIYPGVIAGFMPFAFLVVKKWRKDIARNFPPYKNKLKFFVLIEFVSFVGLMASIYSLVGLSPVVTTAISSTEPMFVLALSYLLCKCFKACLSEKISARVMMKKMFCFVLIVLGVILVTVP